MKGERMKLKQWTQVIVVACSVLTLAACSSAHKKNNNWAMNDTNSAYSGDDAQAQGLGEESGFGDEDGAKGAKKVSAAGRVYYFDFDSDVIRDTDKRSIDAQAERLASNGTSKVMLEGHTDPRGSREYNIGLGERRAKAVAQTMTSQGSKPKQIRVVSYGAEKLASTGHSDSDYQKDRRVVLVDLQS
jgi:peptidoglycan-associated lipoprotein